jgi:hypothetical protein
MTLIRCHRWCHAHGNVSGPAPTRRLLHAMCDEIDAALGNQYVPLDVACESWVKPPYMDDDGDFLARLHVEIEEGRREGSFRRWLAWQHPQWRWSAQAFPDLRVGVQQMGGRT